MSTSTMSAPNNRRLPKTGFLSLPRELRQEILFLALRTKLETIDEKLKFAFEAGTCHCPPPAIPRDKTNDPPWSPSNEASYRHPRRSVELHRYCRPRVVGAWLRNMESVHNTVAKDIEGALGAWRRLLEAPGSDVAEHSVQDNKKALMLAVFERRV